MKFIKFLLNCDKFEIITKPFSVSAYNGFGYYRLI